MIGIVRERLVLVALEAWPSVASWLGVYLGRLTRFIDDPAKLRQLTNLYEHSGATQVDADGQTEFGARMAALEADIRLSASDAGCRCKMKVRISGIDGLAGGMVVGSQHEPLCPLLLEASMREATGSP